MKMPKIKYCSEDFLVYYKANFEVEYLPLYLSGNKERIQEIFNEEVVLVGDLEFNYQPLFNAKDFENGVEYIKQNSKRVFSMLQTLTRTQATKEELWFTMIHTYFLDYLMEYVATIKHSKNATQSIKNAVFFNHGNVRSLLVNHLAKYWWIGNRTYDAENVGDPYWLTDFYTELDATGKSIAFFSSKFTNNPAFALGITEGIKVAVELGKVRNVKETYSFINEHFNFIGGVRILDMLDRTQVKYETLQVIEDLINGKTDIPLAKKKSILGATSIYL